ncbi:MAG: Holliday junction resolvase RuvX [Desulfarculus sp.]|nr:Holliday junction resolvase RuvX [Desulfarculus sp.]
MSSQPAGRVLALDLGHKRIGVAVSDPDRAIAQPLCVIERAGRDQDVAAIGQVAVAQEATLIVLGLPRRTDDSLGPEAGKALTFGKRLGRVLGLPVAYVDEWETTVEAQALLISGGASRARRRQVVDKLAAALILQRFLQGRGVESE